MTANAPACRSEFWRSCRPGDHVALHIFVPALRAQTLAGEIDNHVRRVLRIERIEGFDRADAMREVRRCAITTPAQHADPPLAVEQSLTQRGADKADSARDQHTTDMQCYGSCANNPYTEDIHAAVH
jgi:hypothetical protein